MRVRIYTDGACSGNPGPGGWAGILLLENDRQIITGYEQDTTNNRMELIAAVESVKLARSLGHKKIDLYSDSAYVVNAVKKDWVYRWSANGWKTVAHDDVKNKDLWVRLLKLLSDVQVNFIKVKGHSDNEHNNTCDRLARREIERARSMA